MNFIIATILFVLAFATHIAVWIIKPPKNKGTYLILIFTIIPLLLFTLILAQYPILGEEINLEDLIQGLLISLTLSSSYVMTYPLVELESPTLKISNIIYQNKKGVDFNSLLIRLGKDSLFYDRINDLKKEGAIKEVGNKLFLTNKGLVILKLFTFWRKLLGAEKGG